MARHLAIIVHLDRLWPHDTPADAGDEACFGLNLSTSWVTDAAEEPVEPALAPWSWEIQGLAVAAGPREADPTAQGDRPVIELTVPPAQRQALVDLVDAPFRATDPRWAPGAPPAVSDSFPLHRFLAELGTRPAPVPQALNLSFCFRVPKADLPAGSVLYAAPVFRLNGETRRPADPAAGGAVHEPPLPPGVLTWSYEGAGETIKAYVQAAGVDGPPDAATSYIDLGSLWIKKPEGEGIPDAFGEDWRRQLEDRLAEAFDLGQRLIDAWREERDQLPRDQAFLDQLRDAVVASLRDLAGLGRAVPPDGVALAEDLLDRALAGAERPAALTEAWKRSMRAALARYDLELRLDPPAAAPATPEERARAEQEKSFAWRSVLLREVPELAGTAAVGAPRQARPAERFADELAELERVQGTLADPAVLARVVLAQWRAASELQGFAGPGASRNRFFTSQPSGQPGGMLTLADGRVWVLDWRGFSGGGAEPYRLVIRDDRGPSIALQIQGVTLQWFADGAAVPDPPPPPVEVTAPRPSVRMTVAPANAGTREVRVDVHDGRAWQPVPGLTWNLGTEFAAETSHLEVTTDAGFTGTMAFQPPAALAAESFDTDLAAAWEGIQPPARELWRRFGGVIAARLAAITEIQLRKRLALGNLGRAWPQLIAISQEGAQDRQQLADNFAAELRACYRARLGLAADPRYAGATPRADGATSAGQAVLESRLEAFARDYAAARLLPPDQAEDSRQTEVPHGVTLQIDRLAPLVQGGDEDAGDFLRRIAGIGVLLRENAAGARWRCLNMADVHPFEGAGQALVPGVVVPKRLLYQNGLRETFVTYDNQPLVAESPLAGVMAQSGLQSQVGDGRERAPLFRYLPASDLAPERWSRLPGLKFGREYLFLPFVISNSGALPRELSNGHPARLRTESPADGDLGAGVPAPRRVAYRRRVRVGAPRFEAVQRVEHQPIGRLPLPPIPEGVSPLARELRPLRLPTDPTTEPGTADESALLLLVPRNGRVRPGVPFEFRVRKPATDLQTWDRWVANDEPDSARRRSVFKEYYQGAVARQAGADLTLDDPAVEHRLRFELWNAESGATAPERTLDVELPVNPAQLGLASVQSAPLNVVCEIGDLALAPHATRAHTVRVAVPEGRVYELRIYAPVLRRWLEGGGARFDAATMGPGNGPAGAPEFLFAPLRLTVEAATAGLPAPEELWEAIEPAANGDRLTVHLNPTAPSFRLTKRVELLRQTWRWNGRRVDPFPFAAQDLEALPGENATPATNALLWEAQGFAEREDRDHLTTAAEIELLDPTSGTGLRRVLLASEELAGERRALYYRFAVRVWSRYRGLFARDSEISARLLGEGAVTPWKRFLWKSRWTGEVPRPLVKVILPLTEGDGEAIPGLLVVLDEPWYEVAGLAESLRAEVVPVALDREPGEPPAHLAEIGPDPILTGGELRLQEVALECGPPLGHTFDTDSDAPLFVAASFILPAPGLRTADGARRDLAWHFARVRFLREVAAGGLAEPREVRSAPTEPVWVQFVPDSSRFDLAGGGSVAAGGLTLRKEGDELRLVAGSGLARLQPKPLERRPGDPFVKRFSLWGVITREITDVLGRRRQEQYVDLAVLRDGRVQLPAETVRALPDRGLVVRVLEVQENVRRTAGQGEPDEAAAWEKLFPIKTEGGARTVDDDADVTARIVRISPPIRQG